MVDIFSTFQIITPHEIHTSLKVESNSKEQWLYAAFIPGYSGGTAAALPHSALLKRGFCQIIL